MLAVLPGSDATRPRHPYDPPASPGRERDYSPLLSVNGRAFRGTCFAIYHHPDQDWMVPAHPRLRCQHGTWPRRALVSSLPMRSSPMLRTPLGLEQSTAGLVSASPPGSTSTVLPGALRLVWFALWAALLLVTAVWWWVSPGGFPLTHLRFWTNAFIPVGITLLSLLGLLSALNLLPRLLSPLSLFFCAALASSSLLAAILFPQSIGWVALVSVALAMFLGGLSRLTWQARKGSPLLATLVVVMAMLVGAVAVWAQRAASPGTMPLNLYFPQPPPFGALEAPVVPLVEGVGINHSGAELLLTCGGLELNIHPLITLGGRSPDRCWPRLSTRPMEMSPVRSLKGWHFDPDLRCARLWYEDEGDGEGLLQVLPREGVVEVEAFSHIRQPVYTLANFWCSVQIQGHQELFITFSPCPDVPIAVMPYGGPSNAPLRVAYLDHQNVFRVAEASQGDRGPYMELAVGKLTPDAPLALTLSNGSRAVCRLVFDDWAAQASRSLSPTAGWGLPENAILFDLGGKALNSRAGVWLSLANTFVGAGWDSVGHQAGIYRNRMRVEPVH